MRTLICFAAGCIGFATVSATAQTPAPACRVQGSQQWLATRPSPLDSATLTIGTTVAKICYSRPSLRGRSIATLLPVGIAWRTGANEPAIIAVTGALRVGGALLQPGRYIILTVPQADQWILVFNTTPDSEPGKMFKSLTQVGMGSGRVEHLKTAVEQFTVRAASDSAPLFIMEWGDRRVPISVRMAP